MPLCWPSSAFCCGCYSGGTGNKGATIVSNNKDAVRQQYGAHAEAYVTSPVHAKGASLSRLVELTRPQPDWIVLDVSTGGGHTALAFAPHVRQVIAADLTPEMLAAAEKHAREQGATNIEYRAAD